MAPVGFTAMLAALVTTGASAQEAPIDVVYLHDGGMLRGTIVELVPTEHVTIQLPSGESRTLEMSVIEYAGPAAVAPPRERSAPPEPEDEGAASPTNGFGRFSETAAPRRPARERRLRERGRSSDGVEVAFHAPANVSLFAETGRLSGEARAWGSFETMTVESVQYRLVCAGPCTTSLPRAGYKFALAADQRSPVSVGRVPIARDVALYADYASNRAWRVAGVLTVLAGIIVGGVMIVLPIAVAGDDGPNMPLVVSGATVVAVSVSIGLVLAHVGDSVELRVE